MDPNAYALNNQPEKGNQPGIYQHPDSEETLEVTEFPQADALVRQGWKFKSALRPASERAAEAAKRQADADAAAGLVTANQPVVNTKGNK